MLTDLRHVSARFAEIATQAALDLGKIDEVLKAAHAASEQEYVSLVGKNAEAGGRARERGEVQAQLAAAKTAAERIQTIKAQMTAHREARTKQLDALEALRDQRFSLRQTTAKRISSELGDSVRLVVAQSGDRTKFREELTPLLKNSNLHYQKIVDRVVENVHPNDLSEWIVNDDVERIKQAADIDSDKASRFLKALRNPESIAVLEGVDLEDAPRLELKDGDDYKDSARISTGQRCTTVLPILLLNSDRPLLIDQPEDNLDNAFIYETIVQSVLRVKAARQLIFVTHNPNIPVLGEAERVFVLESDGRRARVVSVGNVDEQRGPIEDLLEGGREAFERRMKKYGH